MNVSLISLALLKSFSEENRKYLDTFIPFVAESCKQLKNKYISLGELQNVVKEKFMIFIPQHALKIILSRMKAKGLVFIKDGVLCKNDKVIQKLNFLEIQQRVMEMHNKAIDSIQNYIKEKFNSDIGREEIENSLEKYFAEYQFDVISTTVLSTEIPVPSTEIGEIEYKIATFIKKSFEEHNENAKYFETLAKGSLKNNFTFFWE